MNVWFEREDCHFQRSRHYSVRTPPSPNSHVLLAGRAVCGSPFPSTFPFSSLNSWVHPPFPHPPLLPPPHRLRSLQRICMSAPEQYEKRWNRTPSGCLCSASLIWQKELQFGPQTQSANKCRLLKGAIRTHICKQTQRYSPRKNLHCTVFSLNTSACRIYWQNWKKIK